MEKRVLLNIRRKRLGSLLQIGLFTLAWGVMTSTVILAFVFQGYLVPGIITQYRPPAVYVYLGYFLVALVAVVSGMLLAEISAAMGAFFASLAVAAVVEYVVLTLPSALGLAGPGLLLQVGLAPLSDMAITIVFYSLFPVPVMLGFIGSLVGAALGETYLD